MVRQPEGRLFSFSFPSPEPRPRQDRFSPSLPSEDGALQRAWLDLGVSDLLLGLPAGIQATCRGGTAACVQRR